MDIRLFTPADRAPCLAVLDSNAQLLPPGQRADFAVFLDHPDFPYFVLEDNTEVVGCGGLSISGDRTSARLLWGMIRQDLQGQGLGRFLLMFRLREIGKLGSVQMVYVITPNHVAPFFEKQGFRTLSTFDDRIELVKKLIVCA